MFWLVTFAVLFGLVSWLFFLGECWNHKKSNEKWEDLYAEHVEEMNELRKRASCLADGLEDSHKMLLAVVRGDVTVGDLAETFEAI